MRIAIAWMLLLAAQAQAAKITAYCDNSQPMASGKMPYIGACAGPQWVRLGTRVYIAGLGSYTVEDRTHKRFNGRYDVWMPSRKACIQFGIRERKVTLETRK